MNYLKCYTKKVLSSSTHFLQLSCLLLVISPLLSFSQTPPNAQFTGTESLCVFGTATFTNQSTQGSSPITTYTWDFGDGSGATTANPSHTYTVPGTYTITLVVQAANGQADSEVKTNFIVVHPQPVANFTMTTNGCVLPVGVIYSNSSTGAANYNWNFGNGQTSTLPTPTTVNYTTPGTYNTTLIATSQHGCKDTIVKPVVISNFQAGINAPATACVGTSVTISDNSTVGANSWSWTFGNGTPASSTSSTANIVYNTPGTYTISLVSQNTSLGCTSTTSKQITVLPSPTASFTNTPTTGCAPLTVNFTNTGTEAGASYEWDFGNGTTSTIANPSTIYEGNGSYVVTLTMTGGNGCTNTVSQNAVTLSSPVANFTSNKVNGCADLEVQFSSTSTSPEPITQWEWIFGDGTSYSGETPPVHSYPVGVYDVALVITTQNGCVDTIIQPGYIEVGEIDDVLFTIDESPQCVKTGIDFIDNTVINAPHDPSEITYSWDFGDGGNSTEQHPTHQYASDTGFFDITLVVTFRGCKDTLVITDGVYIKAPLSRFSLSQGLFCNPASLPVTLNVTDNAIIGVIPDDVEMIWKWGDGTTTVLDNSTLDAAGNGNSSHNYSSYGSFTVEQVIHNYTTGCSDSTTQVVHVSRTEASFGAFNTDSVCVGSPFILSQGSTSTHPFGIYSFNMGNGAIVTGPNPSYAYPQFGDYTITLTATNIVGCADQAIYTPITALALPIADLSASDYDGCSPFNVTFSNESTVVNNGVPLSSFDFTFQDDGSTQTTQSVATTVNHTFMTEGSYAVTLVATDVFGCRSAPTNITIDITKPVAIFSIDSIVCKNEEVATVNTSYGVAPMFFEWYVNGTFATTDEWHLASYSGNPNTSSSTYDYVLIAIDGNGCRDTISHQLLVSTPIANATYAFSGASINADGNYSCPPVFASFNDNSTTLGGVESSSWNFGDGKQSTLPSPTNTYVFPGNYTMTYSITDQHGCEDDSVYVDYLQIMGPIGDPSWTQSTDNCGQYVTFNLIDTSNVTTISWNLGDGTTQTDSLTFTYHYTTINDFIPVLTLTDENNCVVLYPMDTITIVDNGLTAYYTANPQPADLGQEITIIDGSSSSNSTITNWTWLIEGQSPIISSSSHNPTTSYPLPGYYNVVLQINDDNGCTDSYKGKLHVTGDFNMPNVFTPNGDGVNDIFSFSIDIFKSYDLTIVNRWGNVLVNATGMTGTQFWDGKTQSGEPCPDGVYFYQIKGVLKDGTTHFGKEGYITVARNQ